MHEQNTNCCMTIPAGDVCEDEAAVMTECGLPLAQAFVPSQVYAEGFCPSRALSNGTLFPELVRPYC
jgi:hypothetical protein